MANKNDISIKNASLVGILFFQAGSIILMGIITAEAFPKHVYLYHP